MLRSLNIITGIAICSIAAISSAFAQKPLTGKVTFINGDSISGEITQWTADSIDIKSPFFVDKATFSASKVLDVQLNSTGNPNKDPNNKDNIATLKINNRYNMANQHDVIKGTFKQIDDSHITLNTWYAGQLKIDRNMINNLYIDSRKNAIYTGPNSMDEWTNTEHSKAWSYENGSLTSSRKGNIAKDVKLPNKAIISLDHSWKNHSDFAVRLYSSDPEMSNPDFYYELQCRYGSYAINKVFLKRRLAMQAKGVAGRRRMIVRHRGGVNATSSAHYDIYMDKDTGTFHLYINGKLHGTYIDPDPKPEKYGSSIHLLSGSNAINRVRKLTVSRWNGSLPTKTSSEESFKLLDGKGQKVLLKNGDAVQGKVGAIKENFIHIETEHGPLKIPVANMRTIDLSGKLKHEPIQKKEDIKAWFNDTEWIILKPISITGGKLKAYHQAFGEVDFDLNAFKRIELHIYDEKHNEARKTDKW